MEVLFKSEQSHISLSLVKLVKLVKQMLRVKIIA